MAKDGETLSVQVMTRWYPSQVAELDRAAQSLGWTRAEYVRLSALAYTTGKRVAPRHDGLEG